MRCRTEPPAFTFVLSFSKALFESPEVRADTCITPTPPETSHHRSLRFRLALHAQHNQHSKDLYSTNNNDSYENNALYPAREHHRSIFCPQTRSLTYQ